jgi:hypothetical protein
MSANTLTIEDVINTVDTRYQLSLYLKLRGHIAYKAAKLAGQFMAKQAKIIYDNRQEFGIDTFNQAMAYVRGEDGEVEIMSEAGMDVAPMQSMYNTLRGLVEYSNKLNFDMQELVDPSGMKRYDQGFVVRGVFFDEAQQQASWVNSVKLLAEGDRDRLVETYTEYLSSVDDPKWALTEAEWNMANAQEENIWANYNQDIVGLLMDIGDAECEFGDMDVRSQIGAIENMRGKIGACIESVLKSVQYNRELDRSGKVAEATKLKGLINGFNGVFCDMLESSRYANHHEFMYNYVPRGTTVVVPVTRKVRAKREAIIDSSIGRVDDKTAESINESIEAMESDVI